MRIAFLTMGNDIGGAAQDILTLSAGLTKRGHEVFVLAERGVMEEELRGTAVSFVHTPLQTRSPWGILKASRKIRRFSVTHRIDVLNPQGMYTAMGAWMARIGWKRSPFVVITTIHMISTLSLYKFAWALNVFSKRVITESNCEKNRLFAGGARMDRMKVINNCVDTELFHSERTAPVLRTEYKLPPAAYCFGIVARLSPEKRHLDFVEAAKIVLDKHPEARFFIIGDGPERPRIEEARSGYEDSILLTGRRRDIPDVLRSLDCFVLNSKIESLPLSIREAMSMGLPVITTDVGGVREAVLHGSTGFVVPPCQPGRLAEAMTRLVEDRNLSIALGKKGRALCLRSFDSRDWVRKTEAFFSENL